MPLWKCVLYQDVGQQCLVPNFQSSVFREPLRNKKASVDSVTPRVKKIVPKQCEGTTPQSREPPRHRKARKKISASRPAASQWSEYVLENLPKLKYSNKKMLISHSLPIQRCWSVRIGVLPLEMESNEKAAGQMVNGKV